MKFTKEEISLCKQIAEKHEKEIGYGDWYWDEGQKRTVICAVRLAHIEEAPYFIKNCFPLWTISDCLEFLRERAYLVFIGQEENKGWCEVNAKKIIHRHGGKTPLEACLKAVLAVLEEGK